MDRLKVKTNVTHCFTETDEQWDLVNGKYLLGIEKLWMMGVTRFDPEGQDDREACRLAGNAVNLFNQTMLMLSVNLHLPSPE